MFKGRIRTSRRADDVLNGRKDWFRFEALAGSDETAVYIYDEISWFGISADMFVRDLRAVNTSKIALHINSPGGDVFDGLAIYNALKQFAGTVNVTVDGIAASIASVIAMAGDSVAMAQGSMFMIHEPFAFVIGDSRDMRKQADALDLMGDSIAGIYAAKAGGTAADWRAAMAEETWYSAEDAVAGGLADSVLAAPATKNTFDLSIFRNGPRAAASPAPAEEPAQPARPARDWRHEARFAVAAAALEV